jgi:hypothetical protein
LSLRAVEYLDRAIEVRDIFMPEDFFDPLRADPRFRPHRAADGDPTSARARFIAGA